MEFWKQFWNLEAEEHKSGSHQRLAPSSKPADFLNAPFTSELFKAVIAYL